MLELNREIGTSFILVTTTRGWRRGWIARWCCMRACCANRAADKLAPSIRRETRALRRSWRFAIWRACGRRPATR
jgi:hypothetical protein